MKDRNERKMVFHKRMFTNPWNGTIRLGIEQYYGSQWHGPCIDIISNVTGGGNQVSPFVGAIHDEIDAKAAADSARKVGELILEFAERIESIDWQDFQARCEKYAATQEKKAAQPVAAKPSHMRPLETQITAIEEALDAPKDAVKKAVKKTAKKAPKPPKKAAEPAAEGGAE